jgi:hypothetical protein
VGVASGPGEFEEYDPAGHCLVHSEAPSGLVESEGHCSHPWPAFENDPAGHALQLVDPEVEPVPAGQG